MAEPYRQHWTHPGAFPTESGAVIEQPVTAYETWGERSPLDLWKHLRSASDEERADALRATQLVRR